MKLSRRPAAIAAFAAALIGCKFLLRGLLEAQPVATFGELPTDDDLEQGRVLLLVATASSLAAAAALTGAGRPRHALFVAVPGPLTLLLVETTPSNRGAGYLGLLLGVVSLAVIAHAGFGNGRQARRKTILGRG